MAENNDELFVTINDCRTVIGGFCSPGMRKFAKKHGIDFRKFVDDGGIKADRLLATGDAQALEAVEVARGRRK